MAFSKLQRDSIRIKIEGIHFPERLLKNAQHPSSASMSLFDSGYVGILRIKD